MCAHSSKMLQCSVFLLVFWMHTSQCTVRQPHLRHKDQCKSMVSFTLTKGKTPNRELQVSLSAFRPLGWVFMSTFGWPDSFKAKSENRAGQRIHITQAEGHHKSQLFAIFSWAALTRYAGVRIRRLSSEFILLSYMWPIREDPARTGRVFSQ